MSSKRSQPEWALPTSSQNSFPLHLYNSLTRSKNVFVPARGKMVTWYNCGPTVYDSSHMGHARSYITFDIIRRILRDYFHYDVFFVQNVTDIDDKIIRRARQNYLFDNYVKEATTRNRDSVLDDAKAALELTENKLFKETDADKKVMLNKMVDNARTLLKDEGKDLTELVLGLKDVISVWIDQKHGSDITDNSIFISLPRHFENEYNEDMRALNILPPDCVTRVSEFVPEIIDYIQKIIDNGYAYVSNGSVYFETETFAKSDKHFYAKLVPEAYGDNKALTEGEGDLAASGDEKRNLNDFALWKNSKPGEPSWNSPWGKGRPGWHIECSVMASALFGHQMDIHSGGIDLRFPHHDNEMAQSEAYYDTGIPWVNYFLHSGHLTISGCKMSKSLKNFITIKEALQKNTARQLRIAFLLHSWKDTLDYSENTMNDAIHFEKTLNEFFLTVKDIIRSSDPLAVVKWEKAEVDLNNKLAEHTEHIDEALKDNMDTKTACEEIRRLVTLANIYIQSRLNLANGTLLRRVARYITHLMDVFGCVGFGDPLGFPSHTSDQGVDKEQVVLPFLEVIATLREEIRSKAKELKNKDLFELGDRIRDDILPNLGVRMEDYETESGTKSRLKLVDRETLMREREERLRVEETKRKEKEAKKVAQASKVVTPPVAPSLLFRHQMDKYSQWDHNGVPTHDTQGNELTKSAIKKLLKIYQTQEKKYNDYLKSQSASGDNVQSNQ